MEGELAVVWNVKTLLSRQLDEKDTYSLRFCMIVISIQKYENNETNEESGLNVISVVEKEAGIDEKIISVHKMHPIDGAKNGNQARTIKFTTHSYSISKIKKLITEKRKKIQNTSARCARAFSHLYREIELICLEKPLRRMKLLRSLGLLMLICMTI